MMNIIIFFQVLKFDGYLSFIYMKTNFFNAHTLKQWKYKILYLVLGIMYQLKKHFRHVTTLEWTLWTRDTLWTCTTLQFILKK